MPRRLSSLLVLALAAGLLAYGATRLVLRAPSAVAATPEARLAWLAREFSLAPADVAEVARLQTAYAPVCAGHCAAIADVQARLASAAGPGELSAARDELARLERVCAESTRAHLRAVAARMSAPQAARFLAMMEPRVAHTGARTGAPDLAPPPAP